MRLSCQCLRLAGLLVLPACGLCLLAAVPPRDGELRVRIDGASGGDRIVTRFSTLDLDDGLSSNDVRTIAQDHTGFMWFGTTKNGLNRFDAYEFRVFGAKTQDPRGLKHDFIRASLVDRDGRIWVGTAGGGLYCYNEREDGFDHFSNAEENPNSLPHNSVLGLHQDRSGVIWAATRRGFCSYRPASRDFEAFLPAARDFKAPNLATIRSVHEDRRGGLMWFGSSDGLIAFDPVSRACQVFTIPESVSSGPARNAIVSIVQAADATLWLGSEDGLYRFRSDLTHVAPGIHPVRSDGFERFTQGASSSDVLSENVVKCLLLADESILWIGTNNGLNRLDLKEGTVIQLIHRVGDSQSLSDNNINCLYLDSQKNLWVGTTYGGVNRLMSADKPFRNYIHLSGDERSLSMDFVTSLAIDRKERLWVGTSAGLNVLENGGFRQFLNRRDDPSSLSSNEVADVKAAPNGDVWIATLVGGLNRYDGTGFQHYLRSSVGQLPVDGPIPFTGNNTDSLYVDPTGRLWIGARSHGLDYYDGRSFRHFGQRRPNGERRFVDNAVLGHMDAQGGLWYGASQRGLHRFSSERDTLDWHPFRDADANANPNSFFYVLHAGADGLIWFGASSGLYCFDTKSQRYLRRYTESDGLPSEEVTSIVEDAKGLLWLGTQRGLVRFDPSTGGMRVYTKANGLPSNQFSPGASLRSPDGRLIFGTNGGVTSFYPGQLRDNAFPPPVVLTGFELFDRSQVVGAPGSPLLVSLHTADSIRLSHGQSVFSIKFSALDYGAPQQNSYKYKMEGFDEEWRHANADRRIATYTNLPPGDYVFRVMASNHDGVWNEKGTRLPISIAPGWHETFWFYSLASAGFVAFTLGAFRWRMRAIQKRNVALANLVDQKTHELKAAKEGAEAASRAKSTFLASMSHELRTPLNGILGYAQLFSRDNNLSDKQRNGLLTIRKSGEHLLTLINDVLDLARIEAGKVELHPSEFNLASFNRVLCDLIRIRAEQKSLFFSFTDAGNLPVAIRADEQRLRQVLLNLLGNAVKYTDLGKVFFRVSSPPGQKGSEPSLCRLCFEVEDTGIGLNEEQLKRLFRPFEQVSEIQRREGGAGLGLAISRQFVRLMGSDIQVRSEPGKGSCFWFTIIVPGFVADAGGEQPTGNAQADIPLVPPSPEEIEILHRLALRGSIPELSERAEILASKDPRCAAFAGKLRGLCDEFQSKAILSLIERFRPQDDKK